MIFDPRDVRFDTFHNEAGWTIVAKHEPSGLWVRSTGTARESPEAARRESIKHLREMVTLGRIE